MWKERTAMGIDMGLNRLHIVAMVATNILSLYHFSSTRNNSLPPPLQTLDPAAVNVPSHIQQLHIIHATITHLRSSPSSTSASSFPTAPPSELLLYSHVDPIASACSDHLDLLHRYMNYTPFAPYPCDFHSIAEPLLLCRRRHLHCHRLHCVHRHGKTRKGQLGLARTARG